MSNKRLTFFPQFCFDLILSHSSNGIAAHLVARLKDLDSRVLPPPSPRVFSGELSLLLSIFSPSPPPPPSLCYSSLLSALCSPSFPSLSLLFVPSHVFYQYTLLSRLWEYTRIWSLLHLTCTTPVRAAVVSPGWLWEPHSSLHTVHLFPLHGPSPHWSPNDPVICLLSLLYQNLLTLPRVKAKILLVAWKFPCDGPHCDFHLLPLAFPCSAF